MRKVAHWGKAAQAKGQRKQSDAECEETFDEIAPSHLDISPAKHREALHPGNSLPLPKKFSPFFPSTPLFRGNHRFPLSQAAETAVLKDTFNRKAMMDSVLCQAWGLVDRFIPYGIEAAKRTKKQEGMCAAVDAKLDTLGKAVMAAGGTGLKFVWSRNKTYFRGFELDKDIVGDLVVNMLPGYTYSVKRSDDGRVLMVFRRAADGVPELRRRLERLEGHAGKPARRKTRA